MARNSPISATLIGDKQLAKIFKRLEGKEQKKLVRRAMRNGYAKPVAARAKELVPTSAGDLSGTIKVRTAKVRGRPKPIAIAVVAGDGLKGLYASFVELGSEHQPAQSFLRRAADEIAPGADRKIGATIAGDLIKLAKKK